MQFDHLNSKSHSDLKYKLYENCVGCWEIRTNVINGSKVFKNV